MAAIAREARAGLDVDVGGGEDQAAQCGSTWVICPQARRRYLLTP
jgi:hypothetical protein